MFVVEFLFVLLLALVFTAFFGLAGSRYAPWPSLFWLFTVLLLATWALGVWFRPIGPPVWGLYWVSFVFAIVVVTLLLLAVAGSSRPPLHRKKRDELEGVEIRPLSPSEEQLDREQAEAEAITSLGVTFWVLIAAALAALAVHYVFPQLV